MHNYKEGLFVVNSNTETPHESRPARICSLPQPHLIGRQNPTIFKFSIYQHKENTLTTNTGH